MTKTHRMSLERHNAPYRGTTRREDAVNFDLAVLHDLFHAEKVAGGNASFPGQTTSITNNFSALYHGEGEPTASIPTAGKITTLLKPFNTPEQDIQDLSTWTTTGGVVLTGTPNKYTLSSNGTLVPGGLLATVTAEPGDILFLRFKLTKGNGQGVKVAIGAKDFNGDGDDLKIVSLADFSSGQYINKRLYCQSRQDIRLAIYSVYQTANGVLSNCSIEDFSLGFLHETPVGIIGTDTSPSEDALSMKQVLALESKRLSFLEERITQTEGGII